MRYLGIDYGTKRTGVAISDGEGRIAVVKETIESESQNDTIARIKQIVEEEEMHAVVVGMPINMQGERNEMSEQVERFIAKLRDHITVPVQTVDERLTTEMARKLLHGLKPEDKDQVAAQILLQNFLDELAQHNT